MKRYLKIYLPFIIILLLTILLKIIFSINDNWTELIYTNFIFQIPRIIFDSINLLNSDSNFPSIFIWVPFWSFIFIIISLLFLKKNSLSFSQKLFYYPITFLIQTYFWFNILWGFNYNRIPLEHSLNLHNIENIEKAVDFETIWIQRIDSLCLWREESELKSINNEYQLTDNNKDFDNKKYLLQLELQQTLKKLNYPFQEETFVQLKKVSKGFLYQFGISGMYFPFSGEGHIESALPDFIAPEVIVHELSHGYGFAYESDANFIAYLTCRNSNHSLFRYSAHFVLFKHLLYELHQFDEQKRRKLLESVPIEIMEDLEFNRKNYFSHLNGYENYGQELNNIYLKSQGIEDGVLNYNRVVQLVLAYENLEEQ